MILKPDSRRLIKEIKIRIAWLILNNFKIKLSGELNFKTPTPLLLILHYKIFNIALEGRRVECVLLIVVMTTSIDRLLANVFPVRLTVRLAYKIQIALPVLNQMRISY